MSDMADIIPIAEAAKRVHWHQSAARAFAREQGLAIPWPTERRLRVKWSEFKQAAEARRAGQRSQRDAKRRREPVPVQQALHPAVRC